MWNQQKLHVRSVSDNFMLHGHALSVLISNLLLQWLSGGNDDSGVDDDRGDGGVMILSVVLDLLMLVVVVVSASVVVIDGDGDGDGDIVRDSDSGNRW